MATPHTVIVGGSSGIGLATAKMLLAAGHKVSIAGRSAARLDKAAQELEGRAQTVVMDAADPDSVQSALGTIGRFDHLVLALSGRKGAGPLASVDLAEVRQGFEGKFFPQFAVAQTALPFLPQDGSITFVAAATAHAAMPGMAGLGAINAAIVALVPILAVELKPRRVNGVSPGVVDTPWWDFLADDAKAALFTEFAAKTPVGRVGRPEDIAKAIAFLIANDFMTGETIICDGGLRLRG